jgi:hypothetical protein
VVGDQSSGVVLATVVDDVFIGGAVTIPVDCSEVASLCIIDEVLVTVT